MALQLSHRLMQKEVRVRAWTVWMSLFPASWNQKTQRMRLILWISVKTTTEPFLGVIWVPLRLLMKIYDMLLNALKCLWCMVRVLCFLVVLIFWERWPSRTGITIAEMLRERCALQEVIEGDQILRGAQQLLCKYRIGSSVSNLLNITQFYMSRNILHPQHHHDM